MGSHIANKPSDAIVNEISGICGQCIEGLNTAELPAQSTFPCQTTVEYAFADFAQRCCRQQAAGECPLLERLRQHLQTVMPLQKRKALANCLSCCLSHAVEVGPDFVAHVMRGNHCPMCPKRKKKYRDQAAKDEECEMTVLNFLDF